MRIAIPLGFLATAATVATASVTVSGCNQIYGLEKTSIWDAAPGVDGMRTVAISERSVGTDGDGKFTAPVSSAPVDLEAFQHGKLGEAAVSAPVVFAGGESLSFLDQGAWRLVLLRTGQVPHELQFPANITAAHVTIPRWSRRERAPIPGGTGGASVTVSPTNYTYQNAHEHHRIYSTGIFTATRVGVSIGGTFELYFACPSSVPNCQLARAIDGALAAPEIAKGDRYVAIDLDNFNGLASCQHAVGYAEFQTDLVAGAANAGTPPWQQMVEPRSTSINYMTLFERFLSFDSSDPESPLRYRIGHAPSDALPAFTHGGDYLLAGPPMLELVSCASGDGPTTVIPETLEQRFPLLGHVEAARTQTIGGGAQLVNGVSATLRLPYDLAIAGTLEPVAPFAGDIRLDAIPAPTRGENVAIPASTTELVFTDAQAEADYWTVSLYEIDGAVKTLRRVFTVPAPAVGDPVKVDLRATTFAQGERYVFEIRGFTGQPTARQGDFQMVEAQQSMTQVHSATFVVQ